MKKFVVILFLFLSGGLFAQQNIEEKLLGNHMLSLQWISWDYFGKATITKSEKANEYRIIGEQKSKENSDYLKIEGTLNPVSETELTFTGIIETEISHINNGEPCRRNGIFTFKAKGKRKYWRLQDIDNPCDGVADYVDIYFKQ
ncbi:hypothetical protein [Spongiivirga citrea]|uniref:Uncharacterized protein n=1 Tax=Spongiivirga citrea TaxID=1481457 RepID=A0A6M0CM23_9FLAO|nr:hypothetical protein [Spongiivirga citrea]NER18985.1 hypothetical protein [Spongiivirga citrea]